MPQLCSRKTLRKCYQSCSFGNRFYHSSRVTAFSPIDLLEDIRSLPIQFLRASDSSKYDPITYQRTDVPIDMENGKPIIPEGGVPLKAADSDKSIQNVEYLIGADNDGHGNIAITWNDGSTTYHDKEMLERAVTQNKGTFLYGRTFWADMTEAKVRESSKMSIEYDKILSHDGMRRAIENLYRYGILLVTNTRIEDDGVGIAVLGAALGGGKVKTNAKTSLWSNYKRGGKDVILADGTDGPMRTLYGNVWATSSSSQTDGTSVADSAYGNEALPLHTDMTYLMDPPGLQIFTMVQPAEVGGESVFGDGFAIAAELRQSNPKAFQVLSDTTRRYRCKDSETGWHLEATSPVIGLSPNGRLDRIRHNDLDRLPDLPPNAVQDVDAFYSELGEAHLAWDTLVSQDKYRLEMHLQPGDTMVVANQRCFHGRRAFSSSKSAPRIVMGCYVSQEELSSRYRMEGFDV